MGNTYLFVFTGANKSNSVLIEQFDCSRLDEFIDRSRNDFGTVIEKRGSEFYYYDTAKEALDWKKVNVVHA